MLPDPPTSLGPAGVVVGIGGEGLETYRAAVRLGAEEATLRQVPLRLVHGSRPAGDRVHAAPSSMQSRQQRGRRLVNGAARDLAATPLGRGLRIWTESSPRTGVELLLAHSRTAVMLVLQRSAARDLPPGPTASAVAAAAACATLITRSSDRSGGRSDSDVGVLVVLDPTHDPAPAVALALAEAALRRIAVSVLEGRSEPDAAASAIAHARAGHPGVPVHLVGVDPARAGAQVLELSGQAALLVVGRPVLGAGYGRADDAVDGATCPVLVVACA